MTEYELSLVIRAVDHALNVGAPGLSTEIKTAIAQNVCRRVRHQLNMPQPTKELSK